MRNKTTKRILSCLLMLAVILSGVTLVPTDAKAASSSVVQYQKVEATDFADKIAKHEAPACDMEQLSADASGYLFGGWFQFIDDNTVGTAITTVAEAGNVGYVYAKFVPARLTGVSCQVGVDAETANSTNLRVVSTVDSTNYKAVGFNVYGREKDTNGTYDWTMYEYKLDDSNQAQSTKVYSGLQTYKFDTDGTTIIKGDIKKPEDIFGTDATGFKFTTMSLSGISNATDTTEGYYDTTIVIKPYWITLDGTYVEGTGEFNRVNDSPNITATENIINISVNLKDADALAAGLLNVEYSNQNFTFVEAECGRVFEEMEFVPSGNIIKCVGNVSEIANSETPNDIYVNLRFKKTDTNALAVGNAEFTVTVPENGFCNIGESFVDVAAWDVRY